MIEPVVMAGAAASSGSTSCMSARRSKCVGVVGAAPDNYLNPHGIIDTVASYEAEEVEEDDDGGIIYTNANNSNAKGGYSSAFYPSQRFFLQHGLHQVQIINNRPSSYWQSNGSKLIKHKKFRPSFNKSRAECDLLDPLDISSSTRGCSTLMASTVDSHSSLIDCYNHEDDGRVIISRNSSLTLPSSSSSSSPHSSFSSSSASSSSASSLFSLSPPSPPMNLSPFQDPLSTIMNPRIGIHRSHIKLPFSQTGPTGSTDESMSYLPSEEHSSGPAEQENHGIFNFLQEQQEEDEEREPSPPPLSPPIIITEREDEEEMNDYFDAFSNARNGEGFSSEEELPDIDDLPIGTSQLLALTSNTKSGADSQKSSDHNLSHNNNFLPFPAREFDEKIDYSSYLNGLSPMSSQGQGTVIDGQVRHWRERIFPALLPADQNHPSASILKHEEKEGSDQEEEEDLSDDKFVKRHAKYEKEEKRVNRLYMKQQKENAAMERAKQRELEREQLRREKCERMGPRRSSNSSSSSSSTNAMAMDKKVLRNQRRRKASFRNPSSSSSTHQRTLRPRCTTQSSRHMENEDDFDLEICILDEG